MVPAAEGLRKSLGNNANDWEAFRGRGAAVR